MGRPGRPEGLPARRPAGIGIPAGARERSAGSRAKRRPETGTSNANARRESLNQPSDGICSVGTGRKKGPVERGVGVLLSFRQDSNGAAQGGCGILVL